MQADIAFNPSGASFHTGVEHRRTKSYSPVVMSSDAPVDRSLLQEEEGTAIGRRLVLGRSLAAAAAMAGLATGLPKPAAAQDRKVKIYFGAGCFWHVQHEFVSEEVGALSREASDITAISGYAGGKKVGRSKEGDATVCYHNPFDVSDYGQLGHAEVVQLEIPESAVPRFATKYFSLFGERGYRHDPQDAGGEYRSAIGIPGGESSPLFPAIKQAALESPGKMKLFKGEGNEGDTIQQKAVLVYDSDKFPFYPAEVYHQFHNDFMGPAYGRAYNELQKKAREVGRIKQTGCPEMQSWM